MNIVSLLSYVALSAFTPGPNNIMAMSNAAKFGMRRAAAFCAGVFFGMLIDMAACAAFTALL